MSAPKSQTKFFIIAVLVVFLLLLSAALAFRDWRQNYQNNLLPNTMIGTTDFGRKNREQAAQLLSQQTEMIQRAGVIFSYGSRIETMEIIPTSLDASAPAIVFLNQETLDSLFQDNSGSFEKYLARRISGWPRHNSPVFYEISEDTVKSFLQQSFPDLDIPAENAFFSWSNKKNQGLQITPEKIGKEIDYNQVLADMKSALSELSIPQISLATHSSYPEVRQTELEPLQGEAKKIMSDGEIILKATNLKNPTNIKYIPVGSEKLITWVTVDRTKDASILTLDQSKVESYLTEIIAPKINQEAVQPRFEMQNGRVINWQSGQSGQELEIAASAGTIIQEFQSGKRQIDLIIKEVASEASLGNENFKIEEILGTGHSNFKGSSSSRRTNIKVGAAALHGLLIKPGEEFSLINTLGDVSAGTGYLPELVIKGNKTVPEYGGGLCQIGTTVFRAALSSGLPITMRQNHSYRVSYYEPAGTDATIYIPWPDLRFINDTNNYILIQSRIEGNDLYFDFWGVNDGRTATTTYPVIYNIVKPEPTKIIETDTLKPGEKKCTESSHNGADAYFDYTVTYPEGATTTTIVERRFSSHYVPWQAVCLIGASSTTATSTGAAASSTIITPTASSSPTGNTATSSDN